MVAKAMTAAWMGGGHGFLAGGRAGAKNSRSFNFSLGGPSV